MNHTRTPRIGIVGMGHYIYWPQFDGLRDELRQKQRELPSFFSGKSTVVDLGFVDDIDSALMAVKAAQIEDLDALFIVMSTYVPSAVVFPFAKYLRVPQILVGLQPLAHLDYRNTTTYMQLCNDDICSMPEFAGVYERLGAPRPFFLVDSMVGRERIAERIGVFERAIAAVAAFKFAKFGYLGHTYDGMYDMNTDPTAFSAAFGAHVKMLEMCELCEDVESVTEAQVRAKIEEIRGVFDIREPSNDPLTDHVQDADLDLAARCAVGLEKLTDRHGLSALAYYYKGEHGNRYEQIASNLIIGNSLLTSRGLPLAGEADLKTAAAMLIMNRVGGGGSFAELHPFDITDDVVLIGHDGPHNLAVSDGRPILRKLKKFHGKSGAGVSVEFKLKTGPVSLLSCSVTRNGTFRLISSNATSVPGEIPQTGNTNTKCRMDRPVTEWIENWCDAAPTHHLALGVGNRTPEIELFARMMDLELKKV